VSEDPNSPPSREGLTDAQVWEWADDHWQTSQVLRSQAAVVKWCAQAVCSS
jgi:hypothetical protein